MKFLLKILAVIIPMYLGYKLFDNNLNKKQ